MDGRARRSTPGFLFSGGFSQGRFSEVPPGAEHRFFDNRMRQWQTLTSVKTLVYANHKFLISVT